MKVMATATETVHSETRPAPVLPGLPLVGLLPAIRRDLLGTFEKAATLGDVVRLPFPGRIGYLVVHPTDLKRIFVDNHKNYAKQTRGYRMLRLALGEGLVTSEGSHWRRQRRIAQPAFHHQRIAAFADVMTDATLKMLDRWDALGAGSVVEMDEAMMQVTLEIVGRCLMSTDLSDESGVVGQAISTVLEDTVSRVQNPFTLPLDVPTPGNVRYRRALAHLDEVVYGIIRERQQMKGERPPDLLTMFMEAVDEETGERMTEKHLRDEVLTMVSAGHETTANALTWTFYLLSKHPAAVTKLRAELDEVLGDRPPKFEDLPSLRYTGAVVKESMRMRPPVWMVARSAIEEDEVGGVRIEKGSMVFLSPWITQRDSRWFENPQRFDPERFLDPAFEELPKYAYFPFAGGPRVCIGNNFALMEATLLLACIVQRFDLTMVPRHPVVPNPTVTLRPKYGMPMVVEPVNRHAQ